MPESVPLPVIIEPFSTFGDEVAGTTADELAHNLAAATRTSQAWRCKLRRACPDLRALFHGCRLTQEAKRDLRDVQEIYTRLTLRQQTTARPQVPTPEAQSQLSLL